MDLIKENYAEEEQIAKKKPLSSAERQRIYRENNPEKSKEIQRKYREKTSVKTTKALLAQKDEEIRQLKLQVIEVKELTKKFFMEKFA